MAKGSIKFPKLAEFKKPLNAGSLTIQRDIDQRLDRLCAEFGITSTDKYRELCIVLLGGVMGKRGFQILAEEAPTGAPVVWTWERQVSLVNFVDKLRAEGRVVKDAIKPARDKFRNELSDPELKEATVKAQYYHVRKFLKSKPGVSAAVLVAILRGTGPFHDFIKNGADLITSRGIQEISSTHLGRELNGEFRPRYDRKQQKRKKPAAAPDATRRPG